MALIVGGTTLTGTQTLDATKLAGDIADARITSSSVTQHVTATTNVKGSWTPTSAGTGGGSFNIIDARYNRVGNVVHWFCWIQWTVRPNNTSGSPWYLGGLPITSANEGNTYAGFANLTGKTHSNSQGVIPKNSNYVRWARQRDGRYLTVVSNTGTQFEGQHAYVTAGASGGSGSTINNVNADNYENNLYINGYYSV